MTANDGALGARFICPGPFRTLEEAREHGVVFDVPRKHCRWCGAPCEGRRSSFCSGSPTNYRRGQVILAGSGCVHQWMLRSTPSYLRQAVFERDRGVCAGCGLDAPTLKWILRKLPTTDEAVEWRGIPMSREGWLSSLGFARADVFHGSLWQADHIVPVERGGGLCGLDGMQTLCAPCHRRKSATERAR